MLVQEKYLGEKACDKEENNNVNNNNNNNNNNNKVCTHLHYSICKALGIETTDK